MNTDQYCIYFVFSFSGNSLEFDSQEDVSNFKKETLL